MVNSSVEAQSFYLLDFYRTILEVKFTFWMQLARLIERRMNACIILFDDIYVLRSFFSSSLLMIICESSRYVIALSYCLIFLDISLFSQFLRLFLFIGISAPWFPNSSRKLRPLEGSTHGETNVQKKS